MCGGVSVCLCVCVSLCVYVYVYACEKHTGKTLYQSGNALNDIPLFETRYDRGDDKRGKPDYPSSDRCEELMCTSMTAAGTRLLVNIHADI